MNDQTLPIPHLPVEPLFDRIIKRMGGTRITEIFGEELDWDNADYFFESESIVAELKEIIADANTDPNLTQRVSDVYNRHVSKGNVPPIFGSTNIRIDLLPEICQREMMLPYKRKIERTVKKAAKQIKETKKQLSTPKAKGLLILVNEASTFLRPDIAWYFLHHIFNGDCHSNIDHVIYCSVNMFMYVSKTNETARFWSEASIGNTNRKIDSSFLESMFNNFSEIINDEIGLKTENAIHNYSDFPSHTIISNPHTETTDYFMEKKTFYKNAELDNSYYCESINGGTATIYLLESWQNGQFIQAIYDQKLIYATQDSYEKVKDKVEIKRLKKLLRSMRKSG